MKRLVVLIVLLCLGLVLGTAQTALAAVTITVSELNSGQLRLEGQGAVPNHTIFVNGAALGTSDGSGQFKIEVQPYSSATCKVTVSDGTTSAQASLSGCTPTTATPTPTPKPLATPTATPKAAATPTPTTVSTPTSTPTSSSGPAAPTSLSPANGASVSVPFTISWSAATDPRGIWAYNWQLSPSSSMTPEIAHNDLNGNQIQDTVSGLANGTYYWQVQAVAGNPTNGLVVGAWSAPQAVTVTGANSSSPPSPTLNPIQAPDSFHPMEVFPITWSAVPGAVSYTFEAATDPNFPIPTEIRSTNVPSTSYYLDMGDSEPQGKWYVRVSAVNASGIQSVPSNVETFTLSYNAPLPPPPTLLSPANGATVTLPITFKWTDVPNPQPMGYTIEIADDSGFNNIEFLYNQITGPAATITSLTSGTKYWRINSEQGDSGPNTGAFTAWSATGTFVIPNTPPKVGSLAVAYDPAHNGDSQDVVIQLTSAAPSGGAVISLSSSNPAVAPVPSSYTMPGNLASGQVFFTIGSVTAPTPVTITGTLNGSSASVTFTIQPSTVHSLCPGGPVTGGIPIYLMVQLDGAAPPSGVNVSLSSSSPDIVVPSSVTIPAGAYSNTVTATTLEVSSPENVTVSASSLGTTVTTQFTLDPQAPPTSLTITPNPASASTGATGNVSIASPMAHDLTLPLTSSNPSAARVDSTVTILAGMTSRTFNVFVANAASQQTATISVSGAGVTKSVQLTVAPP